ncbi:MAG TPA: membrane protein insertion efficiency factor YidD [Candidatus Aphodousia faecavium]|uniref:Putative membrane protein insertion efficiency factor n=2 Tax=Parasutterella secunda TaxID=626947 RepID=A0ABS2GS97_9BURK|nr:membrane protein insertion efficiency factor YidD [Parasutterella secunda]HIT96625.1 membrane protein insertion efficiency factor YidD [Candidatus Aphodousia faecavium]
MKGLSSILITAIKCYQLILSPWMGRECRFYPTCSQYSVEAIKRFGAFKGSWLMVARIIRCNPWGGQGYDPVPDQFKWFPWKHNN